MNKAQEKLVIENDKLVHYLVRKFMKKGVDNYDYDDLVQIGRIGLIKASKTYNGSVQFNTYASTCITNELFMILRSEGKRLKCRSLDKEFVSDLGETCSLSDYIEAPNSDFTKQIINSNQIEQCFNIALNVLESRDVLIWLYSILGKKQKDLANMFGLTQSYISRVEKSIYIQINKLISRDLTFKKQYHMSVLTDKCTISFSVEDVNSIDCLIVPLLDKFKKVSHFQVTRDNENICLSFLNIEEALPAIAFLISNIEKYSIKLIEK